MTSIEAGSLYTDYRLPGTVVGYTTWVKGDEWKMDYV